MQCRDNEYCYFFFKGKSNNSKHHHQITKAWLQLRILRLKINYKRKWLSTRLIYSVNCCFFASNYYHDKHWILVFRRELKTFQFRSEKVRILRKSQEFLKENVTLSKTIIFHSSIFLFFSNIFQNNFHQRGRISFSWFLILILIILSSTFSLLQNFQSNFSNTLGIISMLIKS